jgi:hypothetical protein
MLAWLAANGMWIAEATGILTIDAQQRAALLHLLTGLIERNSE